MATESEHSSQLPSSSHRLPTVSASEALKKLRSTPPRNVSTGLPRLDKLLTASKPDQKGNFNVVTAHGLCCSHVADVYGPPGVGKTALCMQAAVSALLAGHGVIWIDCGTPMPTSRLKDLIKQRVADSGETADQDTRKKLQEIANRFHHQTITDLAHLLALFAHPAEDFPGNKTALIIVESVSSIFETAYAYEDRSKKQTESAKWTATRKYAIMADLITKLRKMATVNDLVVLLTQQTRMRIRSGTGALLLPSLSGVEWDNGVSTRLVLFRDFPSAAQRAQEQLDRWKKLRYAGLIKVNSVSCEENGRFETVVPFSIESEGLTELSTLETDVAVPIMLSPVRPTKRAFEEIADSEDDAALDEDYGLDEDIDFVSGLVELNHSGIS